MSFVPMLISLAHLSNWKEVMKMKVEFFSAECRLCERTLDILKYNFPALEIDLHRASECKDGSCCVLAEQFLHLLWRERWPSPVFLTNTMSSH